VERVKILELSANEVVPEIPVSTGCCCSPVGTTAVSVDVDVMLNRFVNP